VQRISLTTVARELPRYKLDLLGVQELRWDKGATVIVGDYILFVWKRKRKSSNWNMGFFIPQNSMSS
jgi:hypothetical protein